MLHGGGPGATGMSNYSKNVVALADQGFRVIVPDMPGYGQSTKGALDKNGPFAYLAKNMIALFDAMGIDKAHVIGNSLGGGAALRMTLDHPARVTSVILMGPGGVNLTRELPTKGLKTLLGYYKGAGPSKQKLKDFIHNYLVYDASEVADDLLELRYQASIDPQVIDSPPLGMNVKGMFASDFTRDDRLKNCETPCLVLWGTEDKVNRPSGAETLQKSMINCDVHMFSKTGHWVQWERAEEFNVITAAFMKSKDAA
ncbi:MAG: alpha/beta fold hydrolase [Pseudomonadota bacterium]|nr:alpha/beta fold hydrolase [Pseudomonadota bacterium]